MRILGECQEINNISAKCSLSRRVGTEAKPGRSLSLCSCFFRYASVVGGIEIIPSKHNTIIQLLSFHMYCARTELYVRTYGRTAERTE